MEILPLSDLYAKLDSAASGRLKGHLERVIDGDLEDIRSPFFGERDREEIIALWRNHVRAPFAWLEDSENFEEGKIGPFSPRSSWAERREGVEESFTQAKGRPVSAAAVAAIQRALPQASLTASTFTQSLERMPKDTNLGLPVLSRERKFVSDYLARAVSIDRGGYKEDILPAVLYWRGQATGLKSLPKQRDVWGEDHVETIIGATVQAPFLEVMRVDERFAAWNSLDHVDRIVTSLLRRSTEEVLSIDFSSFDKTATGFLIHAAFDLLRGCFRRAYWDRIDWLERQFLTVGLVTPDGVIVGRSGGVPSGSSLTNLVDCLIHWLIYEEVALMLGVRPLGSTFMGDDGVWEFAPQPPVSEIAEAIQSLGMLANSEKQVVAKGRAHYLQRWHSLEYEREGLLRGIRPTMRTLGSAMSFEHRYNPTEWNPWMHTVRWIMQWENNRWHPNFLAFCAFLRSGDDYLRKGIDPALAVYRAGGEDKVKSLLRLESFPFRTRDVSAFDEFATIQALRSLEGRG